MIFFVFGIFRQLNVLDENSQSSLSFIKSHLYRVLLPVLSISSIVPSFLTMSTSFFDSISLAAMDEINLSLSRRDSDHYDSPLSIKGRACCLMRTVSHALGIGLKPLYYLGFYVLSRQSIAFIRYIPREQLENDIRLREHADELRLIRSLIDNPELVERVKRELSGMPLCALVAPFSQTLQVLKSALGIIHPGLYYQHDPFLSVFAQLTITAKDVGCSPEMITELELGSVIIHDSLHNNMYVTMYSH